MSAVFSLTHVERHFTVLCGCCDHKDNIDRYLELYNGTFKFFFFFFLRNPVVIRIYHVGKVSDILELSFPLIFLTSIEMTYTSFVPMLYNV